MSKTDYALYLVTDSDLCPAGQMERWVSEAVQGGVSLVQLREKNLSTRAFYQAALRMKEITARYGVPLLINDRLDIALAAQADGLHVGQSDLPASVARRLLGEGKILGLSAGNLEEALAAQADGADYLGVGAVFPTATKEDASPVSVQTLRAIKEAVSIPVVAIGGIKEQNIAALYGSGIDGVAVVSAIMASEQPREAARRLRALAQGLAG